MTFREQIDECASRVGWVVLVIAAAVAALVLVYVVLALIGCLWIPAGDTPTPRHAMYGAITVAISAGAFACVVLPCAVYKHWKARAK